MAIKRRIAVRERWQVGPEAERLLREGWSITRSARIWEPPTDVYENDEELVIQVEIAGMREEDFTITLSERTLVIEGSRQDPQPKTCYHQMEIAYGGFQTTVHLPWAVDAKDVDARYEDGFLRVLLPRPPARRVRVTRGREE